MNINDRAFKYLYSLSESESFNFVRVKFISGVYNNTRTACHKQIFLFRRTGVKIN